MKVTDEMVTAALCAKYGEGDVSDMLRGCGDEETSIMRAALTAAIALMRGQSWQPISSPPTEYGWYLCHVEETTDLGISRWSKTLSWGNAAGIGDTFFVPCGERVTHWQHLPTPPKEDSADEQ